MSIAQRVADAHTQYSDGNPEGALLSIATAVDATAKREYGKGGQANYKRWLTESIGLITPFFTGLSLSGVRLSYNHPELDKKPSVDGSRSLEEIIYHVLRSDLVHEGSLPENITLTERELGGQDGPDGWLKLPKGMVLGLIVAVVASPVNARQKLNRELWIGVPRKERTAERIVLDHWWGKRAELMAMILGSS